MDKGYITREYVVWCGCGIWERETSTPLLKTAEAAFKKLGWRKTKKHGWRCPNCVNPPSPKKYKACPHCTKGFVHGRCCLTCEGTGRMEDR